MTEQYTTKDSGQRQEFPTGMRRDTEAGKPRYDLLMPQGVDPKGMMLHRWAELMARGAEKYSARNWEKASTDEEADRFKASAFRHFMQWFYGERDEDHAAAVFFNIQGAEYVRARRQKYLVELKGLSTVSAALRDTYAAAPAPAPATVRIRAEIVALPGLAVLETQFFPVEQRPGETFYSAYSRAKMQAHDWFDGSTRPADSVLETRTLRG